MKALNVPIDPELHLALKIYAAEHKTSITQLVVKHIRTLVEKTPKKAGSK